jgi:hypothetical protein
VSGAIWGGNRLSVRTPIIGSHRYVASTSARLQDSNFKRTYNELQPSPDASKINDELLRVADQTLDEVRSSGVDPNDHAKQNSGGESAKQSPPKKNFRFAVDRSGLLAGDQFDAFLHDAAKEADPNAVQKEEFTPLAAELTKYIALKGPIPISDYMMQCLNHATHGYYHSQSDKIGKQGDFITSPEISQVFGECIAVWCVSTWEILGKPKTVNLVSMLCLIIKGDMIKINRGDKIFFDLTG